MPSLSHIARGRRLRAALPSLLLALAGGCATVPAGHGGVVTSPFSGVQREPLTEGVTFTGFSQVEIYDLRAQEQTEDLRGVAADGAPVQANASVVTWHIVPSELVEFARHIGADAYPRIVRPIVQSAVRRVVARYGGFQLMDARNLPAIQGAITELAQQHTRGMHLAIDGVLIRSVVVASAPLYERIVATSTEEQRVLSMPHEIEITRARGEQLRERGRAAVAAHELEAPTLTPEALQHSADDAWSALATSPGTTVLVAPDAPYVLEVAP